MTTVWLDYFSSASVLLPLIISIIYYKRLNKELKVLSVFFFFVAVVEIITTVMSVCRINNLWVMNIFTLIEGGVLILLIGKWYESKKMFLVAVTYLSIYVAYWCYTTFLIDGIFVFNTKEMSIKAIILIFLSGYLLIKISMADEIQLLSNYLFWICSGILIYFLVSLVVFSSADFILDDKYRAMRYTWTIHSIINIIANLLYFYAFICYRKTNSYSSL